MCSRPEEFDPWRTASWQGAAEASLIDGSRWSMPEKLAWLEEIGRLAARTQSRQAGAVPHQSPVPDTSRE